MRLPRFRVRTLMMAVAVVGVLFGMALRWPALAIVISFLLEFSGAPVAVYVLGRRIGDTRMALFYTSMGIATLTMAQLCLATLSGTIP